MWIGQGKEEGHAKVWLNDSTVLDSYSSSPRAAYLDKKEQYIKSPLGQYHENIPNPSTFNFSRTTDPKYHRSTETRRIENEQKIKSALFMNTENIKRELTQVQLKKTNLPR